MEHLLRVAPVTILSHSLALFCIPLIFTGFWGLAQLLGTDRFLPVVSCVVVAFGLVAGLAAAAINGLALPLFIQNYQNAAVGDMNIIRPILRYSLSLNHAFDYIYIGSVCLSTLCWSVDIVLSGKMRVWIGYFGMILSISAALSVAAGVGFLDLWGFRLFMAGNLAWTVGVAAGMIRGGRIRKPA